jgi:ABC-type antimicrobial peptide transport system permease subunit
MVEGRDFTMADAAGAPRVAVINEVLASRLFAGSSPLGRTLTLVPGARAPWTRRPGEVTIVGVAANVKEVGLNEVEFNDIYVPFAQAPSSGIEVIVHLTVPPASIASTVQAAAGSVDPDVPVTRVTSLDARVADAFREDRFHLLLIGCFAFVGMTLAGIGIYGAVAYAVQQRRREFGVRLALGARPRSLVFAALREALSVAAAGSAVGLTATLITARVLGNALYLVPGEHNGLLYGVTTTDPVALIGAAVGLLGVALCASAFPARGLAKLDPLTALRLE